ncbi:MAG: NADH-quinone oxidoreductase subunit A [Actinomycetaceae bacterium]|nr:NADH-quinone oxidoreductase subunit A [Actinomycetaceae bacterium]
MSQFLIMAAAAILVAAGGLVASALLGTKTYSRVKEQTYECGIDPIAHENAHEGRFPIKYYFVAMTFIVFDIEVVFLYPWAVSIDDFGRLAGGAQLGIYSLVAMMIFLVLLVIPYVYEWRRGGLDWD